MTISQLQDGLSRRKYYSGAERARAFESDRLLRHGGGGGGDGDR